MKIDRMHYLFKLWYDKLDSKEKPDFLPWMIDEFLNAAILKFLFDRYEVKLSIQRGFETDATRIAQLSSLHIKSPELQPLIVPTQLSEGLYELNLNQLGNNINGQYFRYMFGTNVYAIIRNKKCTKLVNSCSIVQTDDATTIYNDSSWLWGKLNISMGKSNFRFPYPDYNDNNLDSNDVTAILDFSNRYSNDSLSSIYLDCRNRFGKAEFTIDAVGVSFIKYPNRVFVGGYDHIDGHSTASSPPIHCDIDDSFHETIVRIAVGLARKSVLDPQGIPVSNAEINEEIIG